MKKVTLRNATASLAEYARHLGGVPLVVTEGGKPLAVLVPIENCDAETLAVGTSPRFMEIIESSRRREQVEGGITSQALRRELGLDKAKTRQPTSARGKRNRTAS